MNNNENDVHYDDERGYEIFHGGEWVEMLEDEKNTFIKANVLLDMNND